MRSFPIGLSGHRVLAGDVHEAPSSCDALALQIVEILPEKGLVDIEALLEQDMLNHYQAKKPVLSFLLRSEQELWRKHEGSKHSIAKFADPANAKLQVLAAPAKEGHQRGGLASGGTVLANVCDLRTLGQETKP